MTEGQAVLWDMDGVLVDTSEFHYPAWLGALSEHGIPFTYEQFRDTFGMNNAAILGILLGDAATPDLVAEIADRKEELFRQAVKGHVRPLPGAREWLDQLRDWGVRQAIASSAPPANIAALVDELGVRSHFDALVSGADLPGKPDPAVFLEAARQIGVPPDRCVVVEDAVAGVEAARRAGMKCIAVTTTNPADALQAADIVIERLDGLTVRAFKQLLGLSPLPLDKGGFVAI